MIFHASYRNRRFITVFTTKIKILETKWLEYMIPEIPFSDVAQQIKISRKTGEEMQRATSNLMGI
jgi:hypothetical protein